MNNRYLVYEISTGLCVNCIVWDGVSPLEIEEGTAIQNVLSESFVGIGWLKDENGKFHPPIDENPIVS
jgi:hypothetical protein